MVDFNSHSQIMTEVEDAQEIDHDNREAAREADHFANKRDGQWEPHITQAMSGRPRYTFDKCNPIIDQVMFPVSQSDFDITVKMAGGEATKEIAILYDGMIRNTENLSSAGQIYDPATREMVTTGIAGWRVVSDFVDADAFDQDLLIRPVSNFVDRVWYDPNSTEQTRADAEWCTVLTPKSKDAYEKEWPKGSGQSVGDGRASEVYDTKGDQVVIGEMLWKKRTKRTLILMSNNAVYEDNEDFAKIQDELAARGVTETRRRQREAVVVHSRKYDGSDWLEESKRTVFQFIPIIPIYGNFKISEGKVIYWGAIEKLMDPQRVYNYARSREIEEGALAPRSKTYITRKQAALDRATLQTQNTNADPVQLYTHVDNHPPPFRIGGPQINQGLSATALAASQDINASVGLFASNMGDNPGLQSGIAIERQQDRGDNGSFKYLAAREVAQEHTCRVLIKAIPQVYSTKRQVRTLGRDGTTELVTLHDEIFDEQTRQFVAVNDLSKGIYDVICTVGTAYRNRQEETVEKLAAVAAIDPEVVQLGGDVLLNNIQSPGFDQIAERKRARMVQQGLIPEDQLTDDEKAQIQAQLEAQAAQGEQLGPVEQALQQQAQAETDRAQANTADIMSKIQERDNKAQLAQQKMDQDLQIFAANMEQKQDDQQLKMQQMIIDGQRAVDDQLKVQAETLKLIREASGADTIIGPGIATTFKEQADRIEETQDEA